MKNLLPSILIASFLCFTQASVWAQEKSLSQELEEVFNQRLKSDEPGGSVLIKKGAENIFMGNYGLADMESKEKITEHTLFNTGSISKTFVCNGILILQEEDKLSIDDPISRFFPDFEHPAVIEGIKIKHLLSHTSGLPDLRDVSSNRSFYLSAKDLENFAPLKKVRRLNFKPGAQFEYSNPAYNGLALIIENLSGQKWQAFIASRIFEPSGMKSSTITDGPHPEENVAHAYVRKGAKYVEMDYGETPTFAAAGNGGVWSSVVELSKYEEALQKYQFIGKETLKASRTIYTPESWASSREAFLGHSWFIGEKSLLGNRSDLGVHIVYHTGSQGGFNSFYITIPEKDLLFVGLFNQPMRDFRSLISESLQILKKHNWGEK